MSAGGHGDDHGGGGLPGLSAIQHWMHTAHSDGGTSVELNPLIIAFVVEIIAFFIIAPGQTLTNFEFLLFTTPLWMPFLLFHFGLMRFIDANRIEWIATQEHILLEIRLPRDTRRTPLAMETVFSSMHIGGGEATWYKRIIQGRLRPWYSYEIVSIGGQVRLFAWMRESYRRPFESFMYAQYPGIEIIEAMDYSRLVDPSHKPYTMTAFEFAKTKPDPYPIKTYTDYGLDKVQKPEEQIDPLAQVFEMMGSLGPQEQLWLQFVVRIHRGEKYGQQWKRTWKDIAKEEIEKIRKEAVTETEQVDAMGNIKKVRGGVNPTEGQKESLKALDRNIGKQAYDVGIRGIYLAPETAAHKAMGGILAMLFKPFNTELYNSIMPAGGRWSDHYNDYPWEDPGGHHTAHMNHEILHYYRMRAMYHPPYIGKYSVMSIEELATVFHVPSSGVTTPTLPRIQSTTSEAPSNLPT